MSSVTRQPKLLVSQATVKAVSQSSFAQRTVRGALCAALLAGNAMMMMTATPAAADEGGVSFWVPGFFGSLAATPQVPGFTFATIYYHTSVSAGADVGFARQVSRGNFTTNF